MLSTEHIVVEGMAALVENSTNRCIQYLQAAVAVRADNLSLLRCMPLEVQPRNKGSLFTAWITIQGVLMHRRTIPTGSWMGHTHIR